MLIFKKELIILSLFIELIIVSICYGGEEFFCRNHLRKPLDYNNPKVAVVSRYKEGSANIGNLTTLEEVNSWLSGLMPKHIEIESEIDIGEDFQLKVKGYDYSNGETNSKVLLMWLDKKDSPYGYWALYPLEKGYRLEEGIRYSKGEPLKSPVEIISFIEALKEKFDPALTTRGINKKTYDQLISRRVVIIIMKERKEPGYKPIISFHKALNICNGEVNQRHLQTFLTGLGYNEFTYLSMGYSLYKEFQLLNIEQGQNIEQILLQLYLENGSKIIEVQKALLKDPNIQKSANLFRLIKGNAGYLRLIGLLYYLGISDKEFKIVSDLVNRRDMVSIDVLTPERRPFISLIEDDRVVSPEDEVITPDIPERLKQIVDKLIPNIKDNTMREILGLYYIEEKTITDIAKKLGMEEDSVEDLLEEGTDLLVEANGKNGTKEDSCPDRKIIAPIDSSL